MMLPIIMMVIIAAMAAEGIGIVIGTLSGIIMAAFITVMMAASMKIQAKAGHL